MISLTSILCAIIALTSNKYYSSEYAISKSILQPPDRSPNSDVSTVIERRAQGQCTAPDARRSRAATDISKDGPKRC